MENASNKFDVSVDKSKSNGEKFENMSSNIYGDEDNAMSGHVSSSFKSKYFQNTNPVVKNSQENKQKSSKTSSVLDSYCKTNILDESDDFIFCESVSKVKNIKIECTPQDEIISCEICKEDITSLDVHNRAVHVNNCIDKQTANSPEPEIQTSVKENVFILECPLCFKHFLTPELRTNHIKKCGKSKGLSLQCIIKALELQERHVLERISLGLPAKPSKPVKSQKSTVSKRAIVEPKNKAQSDIQLAKALSLSLANSDQQIEDGNGNIRFVTLKPPDSNQRPSKRPKNGVTPVLVLRTEEERKKLLLDKVATLLAPQSSEADDSPVDVKCDFNQEKNENPSELPLLWQLCGKALGKHEYYIESLLDWIQPSDVEAGAKLHHLSQIAGHEIVTQLPCDYTFSSQETKKQESMAFTDDDGGSSPTLIGCLRSLVASSWMSDVDIYTACGSVIPAHKLLLAVRCPPLKQDSNFCSKKERVSLKWENISFNVALQFLNFIYTGTIEIEENMKSDMLYLANKYEVSDLQTMLLANKNTSIQSEIEPRLKTYEESNHEEAISPPLSPYQNQLSACEPNASFKAEEDNNMNLEIVYKCINSSMKPSQLSVSEHSNLSSTTSFQSESNTDFNLCQDKYMCTDDSPKKECIQNEALLAHKSSSSPGIFDVSDSESENQMEVDSDNESVELPVNCSQKSALLECNLDKIELDLCSTKSNGSEDSVEFLEMSYPNNDSPSKTPIKGKADLIISSPQCLTRYFRAQSPPVINENMSRDSRNFNQSDLQKTDVCKFEEPVFGNLESPATYHFKSSFTEYKEKINNDDEIYIKEKSAIDPSHKNSVVNQILESKGTERDNSNCINSISTTLSHLEPSKDCISGGMHEGFSADESHLFSSKKLKNIEKTSSPRITSSPDFNDDLEPLYYSASQRCDSLQNKSNISNKIKDSFCDVDSKNSQKRRHSHKKTTEDEDSFLQSYVYNLLPKSIYSTSPNGKTSSSPILTKGDYLNSKRCSSPEKKYELHKNISSVLPNEEALSNKRELTTGLNGNNLTDAQEARNSCENILQDEDSFTFLHSYEYNSLPNSVSNVLPDGKINLSSEVTNDHLNPKRYSPHAQKEYELHKRISFTLFKKEAGPSSQKNYLDDPSHDCNKIPKEAELRSLKKTKFTMDSQTTQSVTPSNSSDPRFRITESPITPFPDYKNMVTPEIKQALRKIGVKVLPRKKAVAVLSHVYNETHPLVNGEINTEICTDVKTSKPEKLKKRKKQPENNTKPAKRQQTEVNSTKNIDQSEDGDDISSENPEWQGCVPEISFSQFTQDSPTKSSKDDIDLIKQYIQSNEELYNNILTYSPLNLVTFHQELKNSGIKISIQKLMDFLDEQCITFTCPRNEEYKKKQTARANRFRKNMIAKMSQQTTA